MLDHSYSYADCLESSIKGAWTVDDCLGDRTFDFSRPFLPDRIAGVDAITCLNADEKRMLNQIRGNSYCHIFAFVEEYIIPMVLDHARKDVFGDETRLRFLVRFAEDETKHQMLLKQAMDRFTAGFGVDCGVIPGREEVAQAVLSKSPLTALLLTSMIEWFTQSHYLEHVRDSRDLDPMFRDILRFHWIDEAQHAKADMLLIDEVAADMSDADREAAVDELLQLGLAIDELLGQQIVMDIDALVDATRRQFTEEERAEITAHQRRAYRWTFIVSGLEHPRFAGTVAQLTQPGKAKIDLAAEALAA